MRVKELISILVTSRLQQTWSSRAEDVSASRLSLESHCLSPRVPKQSDFSYSFCKMKLIYSGDSKMCVVEANGAGCSARWDISGKHLCCLIKGHPLFPVQIIYMRCRRSQSGPQPLSLVRRHLPWLLLLPGKRQNKSWWPAARDEWLGSERSSWQTVVALQPNGLPYDVSPALSHSEQHNTVHLLLPTITVT